MPLQCGVRASMVLVCLESLIVPVQWQWLPLFVKRGRVALVALNRVVALRVKVSRAFSLVLTARTLRVTRLSYPV